MVVPVILADIVESLLWRKLFLATLLPMAHFIAQPTVIPAAGRPPKIVEEFIGRVNSQKSVRQHRQDDQSIGLARAGANTAVR